MKDSFWLFIVLPLPLGEGKEKERETAALKNSLQKPMGHFNLLLLSQSESWSLSFHVKMRFHLQIEHMSGCAPGLALKRGLRTTQKWAVPISLLGA